LKQHKSLGHYFKIIARLCAGLMRF